ncbi:hypothetical protein GCM10009665_29440 [Kitasatospora nipponensis]|uniref:Uncharacterized protein n=1 Tax=Kitasatospora nipponensis TaxID=258049 RepID=A0ABP4GYE2_9ACTN
MVEPEAEVAVLVVLFEPDADHEIDIELVDAAAMMGKFWWVKVPSVISEPSVSASILPPENE